MSDREKDLAIDSLLRAVLGFAETGEVTNDSLDYIESKFYYAYYNIT
ncbi:hypothetical protein J2Z82_001407 [Virgibacillus litoralis]|uniref:Uncharacterized protein n=1 Tax=Virgibacillus litoralis TaxID=578221 RepID=A0ABS4HC47_9BACI|nr:hypothetical protein [Virgibacillus litoralis]